MAEWRWVRARVAWSCRACGARNELRADAPATCRACSADAERGILDALAAFGAGDVPDDVEVEAHPLLPTCGACTALLDVRWSHSDDCVLRCAPCAREQRFSVPRRVE